MIPDAPSFLPEIHRTALTSVDSYQSDIGCELHLHYTMFSGYGNDHGPYFLLHRKEATELEYLRSTGLWELILLSGEPHMAESLEEGEVGLNDKVKGQATMLLGVSRIVHCDQADRARVAPNLRVFRAFQEHVRRWKVNTPDQAYEVLACFNAIALYYLGEMDENQNIGAVTLEKVLQSVVHTLYVTIGNRVRHFEEFGEDVQPTSAEFSENEITLMPSETVVVRHGGR